MFDLTKNLFLENNKCWYKDEYGNTAIIIRREAGFTAKIRFVDKTVSAPPLQVNVPAKEGENGAFLKLNYLDGKDNKGVDVSGGIDNFTKLIQRWIDMLYDISFLSTNNAFLQKANENVSEEDIAQYKMQLIGNYEELKPVLNAVFG